VFSAPTGGIGSVTTIENPIDRPLPRTPSNSQSVKPKDEELMMLTWFEGFITTSLPFMINGLASFLPYLSHCSV